MAQAGQATFSEPTGKPLVLIQIQHGSESFLRYVYTAHSLHALLPGFLLLQKLALSSHVTPVALGYHILADGTNRLPRNHLAADGRLDGHFKQLARNLTTQALYHTPTHAIRLVPVNNKTERVHYIPRNQYVQPDKIPHFIALHLIVEAGVTPCAALQDVKEIQDNLCQRKIICQSNAGGRNVLHIPVSTTPVLTQLHDRTHKLIRNQYAGGDVRLTHFLHVTRGRKVHGIAHGPHLSAHHLNLVADIGRGSEQLKVKLPLQPLPHYFHVQQTQEPTPEAKSQCLGGLWLAEKGRVVESKILQCILQHRILVSVYGDSSTEDHGNRFLVTRQCLLCRSVTQSEGVPDPPIRDIFHSCYQ